MSSEIQSAIDAFQAGDLDRARALAEAQLGAQSQSAQLMHLLGLIECRAGTLDAGIGWLRRARKAETGGVGVRVILARALVDNGQAAEALEVAHPPAGSSPAELALWHVRAEAAQASAEHASAAQAWQVMTTIRPGDWQVWTGYGEALVGLERWAEAADALH